MQQYPRTPIKMLYIVRYFHMFFTSWAILNFKLRRTKNVFSSILQEERKRKKEEEELKKKEERAKKMADFEKLKNPAKPNFVITKRAGGVNVEVR